MKRWNAILKKLSKHNRLKVAEIGVWQGKLSEQLLFARPKMTLYLIDRWTTYTPEEIEGDKKATLVYYEQKIFDAALKMTKKKIKPFEDRVKFIIQDSVKASKKFKDNSLDLVFIDGDHSYEGVKRDIEAWLPKVKKGGWICGHDYTRLSVSKAVHEFFPEVETDVDKTWFKQV